MIANPEHAWDDEIEQMIKWFEEIACNCEVCWEDTKKSCEREWRDLAMKVIKLIV